MEGISASRVNIGCGRNLRAGFLNVDVNPVAGALYGDLDGRLPFADDSADFVACHHVLEHIKDPDHGLMEIARILRPGGVVEIRVPYGLKSLLNIHHRHAFDEKTLMYYYSETGVVGCAEDPERPPFELIRMKRLRSFPGQTWLHKHAPTIADMIDPHVARGNELYLELRRRA